MRPRVPVEHKAIDVRARTYALGTHRWLMASGRARRRDAPPYDVIAWFEVFIAVKVHRALTVWPDDPDEEWTSSDADGSAKVALIGIDRSHAAWLELIEQRLEPAGEVDPFIADLVWLGEALERAKPRARAFVRPAFDETDAVAQLQAAEGDGR
jgi:hypothetical protein